MRVLWSALVALTLASPVFAAEDHYWDLGVGCYYGGAAGVADLDVARYDWLYLCFGNIGATEETVATLNRLRETWTEVAGEVAPPDGATSLEWVYLYRLKQQGKVWYGPVKVERTDVSPEGEDVSRLVRGYSRRCAGARCRPSVTGTMKSRRSAHGCGCSSSYRSPDRRRGRSCRGATPFAPLPLPPLPFGGRRLQTRQPLMSPSVSVGSSLPRMASSLTIREGISSVIVFHTML